MDTLRWVTALSAAFVLVGCGDDRLVGLHGDLRPSGDRVEFGAVLVGASGERTLTLTNRSREDLRVSFDAPPPFAVGEPPSTIPAGAELALPLSFRPAATGPSAAVLTIRSGEQALFVDLTGEGVDASQCGAPLPCQRATLDPTTRTCAFTAVADGTSCSSPCIAQGSCLEGACVGAATTCDDADACTIDSCDASSGCRHDPVECAPPDDPCKAATCDPLTGCTVVDVADGTSCGATDCITAHVCIAGACVSRPAVEGQQCAPAGPCAAASTCHAGTCTSGAAMPMQLLWSYRPQANRIVISTPVQDADDNGYIIEVDASPCCSAHAELVSFKKDGTQRFRVPAQVGGLVAIDDALDRVYVNGANAIAAFDRSGAYLWTHAQWQGLPSGEATDRVLLAVPDERVVLVMRGTSLWDGTSWFALLALDADTGSTRWSRSYSSALLHSVARDGAGHLLVAWGPDVPVVPNPEEVLDVKTGALIATGPAQRTLAWTSALRVVTDANSKTTVLDGGGAPWLVLWGDVGGARIGSDHVFWLDSGGQHALIAAKDGSVAGTQVDSGYLIGDTYVTEGDGFFVVAKHSDQPNAISEMSPQGDLKYHCEIPDGLVRGVALGDQRLWVARGQNMGFDVYALPGVKPSAHGYVAWGGSQGETGPRP